jgi:hypothetical protein
MPRREDRINANAIARLAFDINAAQYYWSFSMEQLLDLFDLLLFEAMAARIAVYAIDETTDFAELVRVTTRWHRAGIALIRYLQENGDEIAEHWSPPRSS